MAYPTTLPHADLGDSPISPPGCSYGGVDYLWTVDGNPNIPNPTFGLLRMYSSTDDGITWTEVDAAHAPNAAPVNGVPKVTGVQDGSTVYFLWTREHGNSPRILDGLTSCSFNLATGLWGATANIASGDMDYAQANRLVFQLILRGAGDLLLLYNSTRAATRARVSWTTYSGGALGAGTLLPSQTAGVDYLAIGGASTGGLTQFFVRRGLTGTGNLYSYGLSSGNVLGVQVLIASTSDPQIITAPVVYGTGADVHFGIAAKTLPFFFEIDLFKSADVVSLDATWSTVVVLVCSGANEDLEPQPDFTGPYVDRAISLGVPLGSNILALGWSAQLFNSTNHWVFCGAFTDESFAWGASAVLWQTPSPPTRGYTGAQTGLFPMARGIGFTAISVDVHHIPIAEEDSAQFYFFTAPTPPPPPATAVHLRITLLGVKRYPALPRAVGKIEEPPKVTLKKINGPGFPGGGGAL